jgi:CRISPR type I-E-associated protein CasB/Cse2
MQPDNDKRPSFIRAWWKALQSDPGARGKLRRCRTPIEAQALPATIDLMVRMGWEPPEQDRYDWFGERIAAAAMVLAHVREDSTQPVARSLGKPPGRDQPFLSSSRWERLCRAEGHENIAAEFTRVVQMIGATANVVDLVFAIISWDHSTNHRAKQQWIYAYHGFGMAPPASGASAA